MSYNNRNTSPSLNINCSLSNLFFHRNFYIATKITLYVGNFINIKGDDNVLNNFNILVIGGDHRYTTVINALSQQGATVYLTGYTEVKDSIEGVHLKLADIPFKKMNAILLPVSGTDNKGQIRLAPYSDEKLFLTKEMLEKTNSNCTIYTGITNEYLNNLVSETNRELVSLFTRNDMAILNSIPTAEGALSIAMAETNRTIHGSDVLILGFGRIGKTVARLFDAVGANVTVCARRDSDLARVKEMGISPLSFEKMTHTIKDYSIIINTIPVLILDNTLINSLSTSLIIDLASAPGGVDFKAAATNRIKAIHALGLPGKVAPQSAGEIIADILIPLLEEQ